MDDAREEVEEPPGISRNPRRSRSFAEQRYVEGEALRAALMKRRGSSKAAVAPPTSQKKPSKSSTAAPKPAKKEECGIETG